MIAPVFDSRYADFASANQDAIREAMARGVPLNQRPIPERAKPTGKPEPNANSWSHTVMCIMRQHGRVSAQQVAAITGEPRARCSNALQKHVTMGRARRVTAERERPAIYEAIP